MGIAVEEKPLDGRCIAVPESRELDLFAGMLERRGATVYRCPLVSIHDSPDRVAVESWLKDFVCSDFDDLILLTGEGLRRLLGFAGRAGGSLQQDFIGALGRVRKITRGPKPGNALRSVGLKPDLTALAPTTEGVIRTLEPEDLSGRIVGVQLYGEEPNTRLIDFLVGRGAEVRAVAPYVYADDVEGARVVALIDALIGGAIDAIAFTSKMQWRRLLQVARQSDREEALIAALNRIPVAAVGPVIAGALEEAGVKRAMTPQSSYFMKPLVRLLVSVLDRDAERRR